jgi:hypothetical protein
MGNHGITQGNGQMESRVDMSASGAAYAPQVEPGHAFGERSTIGICLKHGAFIAQVLLGGGSSECGRCKEPEGAVAANRSDRLDNSLHRAGLPDRLAMASFAGFVAVTQEQRDALGSAHEIAEQWKGVNDSKCGALVLLGGHGTGKTHLAVAISRLLAGARTVHFADVRHGTPVYPLETEVLVLDNLYCRGETPPESMLEDLNEIIRCRADRGQKTVLVSDQDKERFVGYLAPATLASLRLKGAVIVNLNWRVETHLIG